jgi:hypothetical protein
MLFLGIIFPKKGFFDNIFKKTKIISFQIVFLMIIYSEKG